MDIVTVAVTHSIWSPKFKFPICPINTSWAFPISVKAHHILLDNANAIKNGIGFRFFLRSAIVITGVNATRTTSLFKNADNIPVVNIKISRNIAGLSKNLEMNFAILW